MRKMWDKEEENLLKLWLVDGWTYADIANELGRSTRSVSKKSQKLKIYSKNSKKKTHAKFLEEIKDKPLKCLDIYKTTHTKLRFQCKIDGYVWSTTPAHIISAGQGCPKCGGGLKKTHEQFLHEIKDKPFICLGIYTGAHIQLKFKCNVDGHIWTTAPHEVLRGSGCPKCGSKGAYSYYSEEDFKSIKEIYLYKVLLEHKDESFYKVGISTNIVSRFRAYSPYKVKKILVLEKYTNAKQCFMDEQWIHSFYSKYKYSPKYKFNGHTECFIVQ